MENIIQEPALKYNYISAEEYLSAERQAVEKHEYYQGEVFAMSCASLAHNIIFANLFGDLSSRLKGHRCRPYCSDLRIHIPRNTLYTYSDVSIICDKPSLTDENFDTATNPSVIIELLSKSTRSYDLGQKFTLYRDIPSLKEYILIDTEAMYVQKNIRNTDNSWLLTELKEIDGSITLDTIQLSISVKDIYEGITFE